MEKKFFLFFEIGCKGCRPLLFINGVIVQCNILSAAGFCTQHWKTGERSNLKAAILTNYKLRTGTYANSVHVDYTLTFWKNNYTLNPCLVYAQPAKVNWTSFTSLNFISLFRISAKITKAKNCDYQNNETSKYTKILAKFQ